MLGRLLRHVQCGRRGEANALSLGNILGRGTSIVVAAIAIAAGATSVKAGYAPGRHPSVGAAPDVFLLVGMVLWSTGTAWLAMLDLKSNKIPRGHLTAVGWGTLACLLAASLSMGYWGHLVTGVICALLTMTAAAIWYARCPGAIGFGDVRLAGVVALGSGSINPAWSITAVICAIFASGAASKASSLANGRPLSAPLGPFLVAGGVTSVVVYAH